MGEEAKVPERAVNGAKPTKNRTPPHKQHGKYAGMLAFLLWHGVQPCRLQMWKQKTGANGGCNRRVTIEKGHSCICYELGCLSLKTWNILRKCSPLSVDRGQLEISRNGICGFVQYSKQIFSS